MVINSQIKGISTLESLLVLVVVMAMLVMSVRYYYIDEKIKNINQLKTSVNYLFDSLNNYYVLECKKNNIIVNRDIKAELVQLGLLTQPLYNPWGGNENLTAEIVRDDNQFFRMRVTATLITDNKKDSQAVQIAEYIRNILGADPLGQDDSPIGVVWTRLPSYSRDGLNSLEWIFEAKPVSLTSVNEGLNSNLWVLDRNLTGFTRKNDKNTCPY